MFRLVCRQRQKTKYNSRCQRLLDGWKLREKTSERRMLIIEFDPNFFPPEFPGICCMIILSFFPKVSETADLGQQTME